LAFRDPARSRSGIESPKDVPARSGFIRKYGQKLCGSKHECFRIQNDTVPGQEVKTLATTQPDEW